MTVLIIVVLTTILVSASCSLYEALLYSTRMGTLESAKTQETRPKLARQFIAMKKNISVPIAAILILNTVANTAGATIAGMYAADTFGAVFMPIFSILFTLAILFLSEIAPKTIGAIHWRKLWPMAVLPVTIMKTVLYPVIIVTEKFTGLFINRHKNPTITEDEILAMISLGTREGEISREEGKMVHNIIDLEEKTALEILTPRRLNFSLDIAMPIAKARELALEKEFSRIPVFKEERENIVGYVTVRDLCFSKNSDEFPTSLESIRRDIMFFPATTNCLSLLTSFLKDRLHIAIITDEFNGVAGIVTLEDLIETVLGREIVDELDKVVDLQKEARKHSGGYKNS